MSDEGIKLLADRYYPSQESRAVAAPVQARHQEQQWDPQREIRELKEALSWARNENARLKSILQEMYGVFVRAGLDRAEVSSGLAEESIACLGLSVRAYNCLIRADIRTVGDLLKKTEWELTDVKNFGRKSLDEVVQALARFGVLLPPAEEYPAH